MNCHELDNLLCPYLDGEFSAAERAELDQHLGACPTCAARVERERRLHGALRARLQEQSPVAPPALHQRVKRALDAEDARASRSHYLPRFALAAGVLVACGVSWQNYRVYKARQYAEDAAGRHARHFPLEIQTASPEQLARWFNDKLDHRVAVPNLPNTTIAGGRLLNVGAHQAAYFRYDGTEPSSGALRMGLFVFSDARGDVDVPTLPEVAVTASHGFNVVSARDGDLVYTLVTDTTLNDVEQLRAALQQGVRPQPMPRTAAAPPQVMPVSLER